MEKEIKFNPQSVAEILSREPEPIKWVWQDYIAEGDLFIFAAYMKVGKSVLSYLLLVAVARGEPFLDRSTGQGGVLILALEEHPRDVELRLRKLGVKADDPIFIHKGPLPNKTEEIEEIRGFISRNDIALVMIDSLPYFWNVKNENDNAQIVEALKPLLELARATGAAIGLIHHESKYGGRDESGQSQGNGKSIRGGSALFGIVDQAILLDRRQGGNHKQRVVRTTGRRESPLELIIELEGNPALSDPNPYNYRVLGTPEELTKATNAEKVLAVLSSEPQDLKAIGKAADLNSKATREACEELFREGKALREGKGVKRDPFTYRLDTHGQSTGDSSPDSFPGFTKPSFGQETNVFIT